MLCNNGVADPRAEAALLLSYVIRKGKTFLIAHPEHIISEDERNEFAGLVKRRASREPLQYITGHQEFFGIDFVVTPDVLIPRPETELLVETAIETLRIKKSPRFCEVGTGSGCISISILHHVPNATAVAADISEKALAVTSRNAEIIGVAARLDLRVSDVFEGFSEEHFDLIVSNPPYVTAADLKELQPEVRDNEPHSALSDGADGLSVIRRIIAESPKHLKPQGWLILEIGYEQADRVTSFFRDTVWKAVRIRRDLQGIPRTVVARKVF